jgi:hypothetical protein
MVGSVMALAPNSVNCCINCRSCWVILRVRSFFLVKTLHAPLEHGGDTDLKADWPHDLLVMNPHGTLWIAIHAEIGIHRAAVLWEQLILLALSCVVNTRPATKLGVGLLSVVDRTFSGAQNPGLECAQNGWFIGLNASPEKKTIRPVGQPVVDGEGRRVLGMVGDTNDSSSPAQRQTSWCVFLP